MNSTDKYSEFQGLSIRAMTMIGVVCFQRFCERNNISSQDIELFNNQMLLLLSTDDISDWDTQSNLLNITGLGDPLPNELKQEYPEYFNKINRITEFIREISASQIYGAWIPNMSYDYLVKIEEVCEINISKEFDLSVFKKHKHDSGWGKPVKQVLINEWIVSTSQ